MESMLIYIWHLLITMGESKEGRKTSKTEKARQKNLKRLLSNKQIWLFLMLTSYNQEGCPFPSWFKKKNSVLIFAWQL